MSRTNLESNLSSAQSVGEKLLILLKKHGPMQASEAGEHLGTTGEAARQQFTKLARDGMVEAHSECRGVGRPVQRWHLTALGNKRFPDCHAELTVKILTTIRRELGEDAIGKILPPVRMKPAATILINFRTQKLWKNALSASLPSAQRKAIWRNGKKNRKEAG